MGLTIPELFDFMEMLNRMPATSRSGWLGEICRMKARHVSVDEFVALVSRDGELVAETFYGPIDSALEDIVFEELKTGAEGRDIRDIPAEKLVQAFQKISNESQQEVLGKYRSCWLFRGLS